MDSEARFPPQLEVISKEEVPTPQEYKEAVEAVTAAAQRRDELFDAFRSSEGIARDEARGAYNAANNEYHEAKEHLANLKRKIMEETDAVEYEGNLVVLAREQGPKATGIRVKDVYGGSDVSRVKQGAFFTADLANAPEDFRNEMFKGPFTINFDGTLGERYTKIPNTDGGRKLGRTQTLPKAA